MKVHSAAVALVCISGVAWATAGVCALTHSISVQLVAVFIGLGVTAAAGAVTLKCMEEIIGKLEEHTQRIEKATADHAELLANRILTIEHFFGMGQRSDALAQMSARGTGPFRAVSGDR